MYSYASYYQLIDYLSAQRPQAANIADLTGADLAEQVRLMGLARAMSKRFERETWNWFMPFSETRYFDALGGHIVGDTLLLNAPLASLTSVTLADDSSLTVDTDVRIIPRTITPGYALQLLLDTNVWTNFTTDWREAIQVAGVWVARSRYSADAWVDTDDAVGNDPLTSSGTSITVASAVGADTLGVVPRFDIGQLIRIDSEYMVVTGVNYTSDKAITVLRGQNGTTAAAHDNTTQIDRFDVEPEIVRECAVAISTKSADIGREMQVPTTGQAATEGAAPDDLPDSTKRLLEDYAIHSLEGIG